MAAENVTRAERFLKQDRFRRNAFLLIEEMVFLSPDHPSALVDEVLHSIFFLGKIHSPPYLPDEIVSDKEMLEVLMDIYPRPFSLFFSKLPKRSPFSCVLDMIVHLIGQEVHLTEEDKERKIIKTLRDVVTILMEDESRDLISSTICVSQSILNSVRYYGVSMSTSGRVPGRIMVAASLLSTWDSYVADAVMTYSPNNVRKNYFDGTIQIQELIRCEAFSLIREGLMPPCRSCGNLFGLTTCEIREWPYGSCAEAESISNLLKKEDDIKQQIRQTPDRNTNERQRARKSVETDLRDLLRMKRFPGKCEFYEPHKINLRMGQMMGY